MTDKLVIVAVAFVHVAVLILTDVRNRDIIPQFRMINWNSLHTVKDPAAAVTLLADYELLFNPSFSRWLVISLILNSICLRLSAGIIVPESITTYSFFGDFFGEYVVLCMQHCWSMHPLDSTAAGDVRTSIESYLTKPMRIDDWNWAGWISLVRYKTSAVGSKVFIASLLVPHLSLRMIRWSADWLWFWIRMRTHMITMAIEIIPKDGLEFSNSCTFRAGSMIQNHN